MAAARGWRPAACVLLLATAQMPPAGAAERAVSDGSTGTNAAITVAGMARDGASGMAMPGPGVGSGEAGFGPDTWSGVSYGDAFAGLGWLAGGTLVAAAVTGSTGLAVTTAMAVAVAYVLYDPGATGILTPNELPTLSSMTRSVSAP